MPLIKAQCTNCQGILEININKEVAFCPYCGTPYILDNHSDTNVVEDKRLLYSNASSEEKVRKAFGAIKMDLHSGLRDKLFEQCIVEDPTDWRAWFGYFVSGGFEGYLSNAINTSTGNEKEKLLKLKELIATEKSIIVYPQNEFEYHPADYFTDEKLVKEKSGILDCAIMSVVFLVAFIYAYYRKYSIILLFALCFLLISLGGVVYMSKLYKSTKHGLREKNVLNQNREKALQEKTDIQHEIQSIKIAILNEIYTDLDM